MNTVHSVMAYTTSALALTYIYLGNVTPNARLTPTITRFVFSSTTSSDMVFRGYELPRLNERLVYLIFFGFHTSILYGILQKAIHRTRLPYKSVSVTNYRLQLSLHVGICTRRIGQNSFKSPGACHHSIVLQCNIRTYRLPAITSHDMDLLSSNCEDVCQVYFLQLEYFSYTRMPRSPAMPDYPVKPDLFLRSIWLAFLMLFIWESANVFFDTFISNVSSPLPVSHYRYLPLERTF